MILRKLAIQRIALKVGLYAAFTASFWLAFWLRFYSGWIPLKVGFRPSDYFILYLVAIVAWGAFSRLLQLDQLWVASNPVRWIGGGAWATLGTLMVIFFGAFFVRAFSFSRLFVVLLTGFDLLSLAITLRILLLLARRKPGPGEEIKILIIGHSDRAQEISEILAKNSWIRCHVVGYLAVDKESPDGNIPVLGQLESLEAVCRQYQPDEILVAVPLEQLGRVAHIKGALARVSVPSRLVCNFLKEVGSGGSILDFFGMPVVNLHQNPGDSLVYGVLKRSLDLIVASVLLVLLMPLMLLIAVLVKLTSPGPVMFSQKRVGLHGRSFTMHKFRTMWLESQESPDVDWTVPKFEALVRGKSLHDRCTPLGSFLRRFGLDELPQLWNVFRGAMSLVGPRPERPFFVDKFGNEIEGYNIRHFLKSGITGWAQVNGLRGDTSIAKRIEYDLYYLTHWSLAMDLKILWLTLWRGFRDRNAY